MSLHDGYARQTPWELTFPSSEAARAFVDAVAEEAAGRGADPDVLDAFLTMGAVDHLVRELEGADGDVGALAKFGGLAFQAFHFTRHERPLYLLSVHVARYLVEGVPSGTPTPPGPAGYLQLPQHLFWAAPATPDATPESIDGIFWTATPEGLLHSMLATGLRPDRPGIGVVPLPPAPMRDASTWLTIDARGDTTDFDAALPGGELDGLYGVATAGEVLKLLARFFAYVDAVPQALEPTEAVPSDDGPPPSSLPFTRVTLSG